MKTMLLAASAALALTFAGAANAVTYDLTDTPGATYTELNFAGPPTLNLLGYTYENFSANALTGHDLSEFVASDLWQDANGVGVCNEGQGNASCETVDTNPVTGGSSTGEPNEAILLTFGSTVTLNSITITNFLTGQRGNGDSTFALWSVADNGDLTDIFHLNPIVGSAPLTIDLSSYGFTGTRWSVTAFGGNDNGYQVTSINATGVVPEPATWAFMILGFGGAGAMLRRRRLAHA